MDTHEVMEWTPNQIDVIMHFYTSGAPHPRDNAGAVKEAITYFLANDLLEPGGGKDTYKCTERAKVWCKMICKVRLPDQAWLDKDKDCIYKNSDTMYPIYLSKEE